ncbi:UNVERIFIED_CONTAM: hypothetical protein K2H54_031095 [Gekko kuhli]
MKPIILLFITGILANSASPPNSGNQYYNNNCDNRQYPLDRNHPNQPNLGGSQSPNEIVVGTNTNFAFKFLKLAASNGDQRDNSGKKNLVFSPMCISSAFAMLALGARSETSDQILRGLNFQPAEITERNIHEGFHDLIYLLNSGSSGLHMEMGCCLFVQNKLHPQPDFLYGLRNIYRGDIYMENFKNTAETIQHINSYVERKTHGKISKLIDRVDPITEILMVSFFYMKGLEIQFPFTGPVELSQVVVPDLLNLDQSTQLHNTVDYIVMEREEESPLAGRAEEAGGRAAGGKLKEALCTSFCPSLAALPASSLAPFHPLWMEREEESLLAGRVEEASGRAVSNEQKEAP